MSKPVMSDLFKFSGRRNRKSYLFFLLGVIAIEIVLTAVFGAAGGMAGSMMEGGDPAMADGAGMGMMLVLGIVFIVLLVSSLAVGSQRCRDFGWTGWAMLLLLVPFIGWIFALAIIFIPGNQGPNRYGPDPLQEYA